MSKDTTEDVSPAAADTETTEQVSTSDTAAEAQPEKAAPASTARTSERGRVSVSISTLITSLLVGLLIIGLTAATVVFAVRDSSARSDLNAIHAQQRDDAQAEKVAGKYAVAAATLDYQDLTPWIAAMKKGVSPDLAKRYDAVGQTMDQIITPLRMKTTAELVTTSVAESEGDLFRVDAVVNVKTVTVQNPAGGNAVAVYKLTLDRSHDWMITEVGDPTDTVAGTLGSQAPAAGAPAGENPAAENPAPENPAAETPAPETPAPGN